MIFSNRLKKPVAPVTLKQAVNYLMCGVTERVRLNESENFIRLAKVDGMILAHYHQDKFVRNISESGLLNLYTNGWYPEKLSSNIEKGKEMLMKKLKNFL